MKLNLNDLVNLENEVSAVNTINGNNTLIENALENTLSRDGTSPNSMQANIDMNSNRLLNLPPPESSLEPLRVADTGVYTYLLGFTSYTWLGADRALANVNTAQNIFDLNTYNLEAGKVYHIQASIFVSRSAGTTAHTIGFKSGGTATYTDCMVNIQGANGISTLPTWGAARISDLTANTTFTASDNNAAEKVHLILDGTFIVNAAGTFVPQLTYSSAPGGAPTVERGSYMKLTPLGPATANTSGGWI